MNIIQLKNAVESGKFDKDFALLYGDTKKAAQRYSKAVDSFREIFGEADGLRLFSAPGRTEIGGNHTDHQHGCVLAGSVDLDVIAVVAANDDGVIRIKSEGYDMDSVDITEFDKTKKRKVARYPLSGVCATALRKWAVR